MTRDGADDRVEFNGSHDYCRTKWEFSPRKAYYLIAAASLFTHLCRNCADRIPERESQLRPLLSLEPAQAQAVWQRAVEKAGGREFTASRVNAARKELQPGAAPSTVSNNARQNKAEELLNCER